MQALVVAALAASPVLVATPALAADDFTWTGAGVVVGAGYGNDSFSVGTNWAGGQPPHPSVASLSFPSLGNCPTSATNPPWSCYDADNNLTGLSARGIDIADSRYEILGNGLTLGDHGLTVARTPGNAAGPTLGFAIALSSPQTWSVDGGGSGLPVQLDGQVTGQAEGLTIRLRDRGGLDFRAASGEEQWAPNDVGPVTIEGADPSAAGEGAAANGEVGLGALNRDDGNPVDLIDAQLSSESGAVGPLTSTGGLIVIHPGAYVDPWLAVTGGAQLDPGTALHLYETGGFSSTLRATGHIDLRGARLLFVTLCGQTPPVAAGTVNTLVQAGGSLTGTFAGLPDGASIPLRCDRGGQAAGPIVQWFRIHYSSSSVTATSLGSRTPSSSVELSTDRRAAYPHQPVLLTATVRTSFGDPFGEIGFTSDGRPISGCGRQPLANLGGAYQATCTAFFGHSGSHAVRATFSALSGERSSSSPKLRITVIAGSRANNGRVSGCANMGAARGSVQCHWQR